MIIRSCFQKKLKVYRKALENIKFSVNEVPDAMSIL